MRIAVVLDEAHRLIKDLTLPRLLKEGRKYGVSAVVASQGATDFHRDVLANAGTKIVFRTNYPGFKVAAGFLRGRDGQDLSHQIEQLIVGCAYVSTPDHTQARRVYMHT
jgi:DNA phosphorothioation-dependent restriction protein DptH